MENEDDLGQTGKEDALPLKPNCEAVETSQKYDHYEKMKTWVIYMISAIPQIVIAMNVTSTWSYLQKIDPKVSPTFFGWANFGYYCAAIAADVAVGRWMHSKARSKDPLITLCLLLILSILLYVFAQGVGGKAGLSLVLVARVLLGTQRGMLTVARTLISYSTSIKERSQIMVNFGISNTVGFFVGSGIQAAIAQIGEKSAYVAAIKLHLNLYTIPSCFALLVAGFTIILVWYQIKPVAKHQCTPCEKPAIRNEIAKREIFIGACLILLFTLVNFSSSFSETLTIPFLQHQFALTKSAAVWYGGLVLTSQGIIATLQQVNMKLLLRRFTDRKLILIGYACCSLTFLLYIPFGAVNQAGMKTGNSTVLIDSADDIGCPVRYHWCRTSPRIWLPQFILGAVLHATGLSFCVTLLVSLYSKVLVNRNQGSSLGLISAAGNLGRLVAPIASSASYVVIGPQYTYLWAFLIMALGMVFYVAAYRYMLPNSSPSGEGIDTNSEDANFDTKVY